MPEALCFDPGSQRGDPSIRLTADQVTALQGMVSGDVKSYGAKADLVCLQVVQVTAGSVVADSTDAAFTAADVGKIFAVTGAGASIGASPVDAVTLYGPHVTTIARVISPTRIEMADPAVRSVYTGSGTGVQYVSNNTTAEAGAKAYYGTDDTAAIQQAVDTLHPLGIDIRIPSPGCMVTGTIYCQTSRDTGGTGLLYKRLSFRGVGPTVQSGNSGSASKTDSNLFKPNVGNILAVNLDASGAGMTSTGAVGTHQFFNFHAFGIAFCGLPGNQTYGMRLHRVRATIDELSFNGLACGWDGRDNDVNGAPNYCDQWRIGRIKFNNCAQMFRQRDVDSCEYGQLLAESHYPTVTKAIEIYSGRGWTIKNPLIAQIPKTATMLEASYVKEGIIQRGHFENIWGPGISVIGTNGASWVDVESCDFYTPSASAGITADTIKYVGAGGRVEGCGFSHNRASGYDINFGAGRHQSERNNQFFEADNATRRRRSVYITMSGQSIGTSSRQPMFVNVVYNGSSFDIRNTQGSSVWPEHFSTQPGISGGNLRLDGSAIWGLVTGAIPIRKAGKYTPIAVSVEPLVIALYDDAGVKVTVADTNMDFWLLVM